MRSICDYVQELVEDQKLFVLGFGDTPTTYMSNQLL